MVLMIVRWDGMLGFAGGVVEPEEAAGEQGDAVAVRAAVEQALRRELREELGVTEAGALEHICTHLTAANGSRSHFWAREVDEEKFIELESGVRRGTLAAARRRLIVTLFRYAFWLRGHGCVSSAFVSQPAGVLLPVKLPPWSACSTARFLVEKEPDSRW